MPTALLIVDVQRSLIEEETWGAEQLLDRVTSLEQAARAAGAAVVWITDSQVGPYGDLHEAMRPKAHDLRFTKSRPAAFDGTGLRGALDGHGIDRLVVCGLQTDCCIRATVRSAADLGYRVVLAGDAHSTFDREGATAEQVIAEHNRALASVAEVLPAWDIDFSDSGGQADLGTRHALTS
ncbi:isochorismatase family protein [Rubellimicrobium rubrum]|uniref:Isochorismatase family protein n=1 Tax=Rubellimicrobium rubrum TaxID=2585369 RepID=A0A5C4MTL9_9RHOB|nr:isochorismatase family protein [Rubellimicrobium rubrum]TNC48977.1 isochorismatase family protein [Rubellimicrobium rubrum]